MTFFAGLYNQVAVYWPIVGRDRTNEPLIGDPVQINVRWEARHKEVLRPDGTRLLIAATVWADRSIPIGSQIWLGEVADWSGTGIEGGDEEIMYVATRSMIPDERGVETEWKYDLTRFRDRLGEEG